MRVPDPLLPRIQSLSRKRSLFWVRFPPLQLLLRRNKRNLSWRRMMDLLLPRNRNRWPSRKRSQRRLHSPWVPCCKESLLILRLLLKDKRSPSRMRVPDPPLPRSQSLNRKQTLLRVRFPWVPCCKESLLVLRFLLKNERSLSQRRVSALVLSRSRNRRPVLSRQLLLPPRQTPRTRVLTRRCWRIL